MPAFRLRTLYCLAFVLISSAPAALADVSDIRTLAGEWRFALDRTDVGVKEAWFNRTLADRIRLPGVLQAQGYGDEISTNTPWVLSLYDKNWYQREDYKDCTQSGNVKVPFVCQPPRHYLGAAWYQCDVEIPEDWMGRRIELFLERTRWETRAWLDDQLLGTNNSLCAPHQFEAGVIGMDPDQIKPGRHRLTVRCDNRMLMAYRPDAHAVSDSLNSTWNGIVGRIELRSTPLVWIKNVRVFPNIADKSVKVEIDLGNKLGHDTYATIHTGLFPTDGIPEGLRDSLVKIPKEGCVFEALEKISSKRPFWDEFSQELQTLTVTLSGNGIKMDYNVQIGVREFKAVGQQFFINGRPTHLRGTHHGGDFALTGYPPCDTDYWLKLFRTCKDWGLNHVRFHSFCPPEAAFTAADEVGIYLQIEPGMWNDISPGTPMEAMLYAETERILAAYGNHPSFVLMSASNEAKGRWKEALTKWVRHFRQADSRRLYTPDTGWSLIDEPGPVEGADYLAVHRIGNNLMRGDRGWFGRDYARATQGVNVPIVTHEVGQWCAYPDFDVIKKFTGYMRPGNFEIFRDSAQAHGLFVDMPSTGFVATATGGREISHPAHPTNKDFAWASGKFQLACYKEEIEANLRTPGLAGFQLLDLHDYVGQGTALVGLLDPFWESKGYVSSKEWRQFCSPVVPLARLTKRVFTTADNFDVPVELVNYGGNSIVTNAKAQWTIRTKAGRAVVEGNWTVQEFPNGVHTILGNIRADMSRLPAPASYDLFVEVQGADMRSEKTARYENSWNFWLYPAEVDTSIPNEVLLTSSWVEAEAKLAAGGRVVFQTPPASLDWSSPPLDKLPIFWNRLMGPGWSRMLGIWCDTKHPALAGFPTEANCDWQWIEMIKTRTINLDRLPRDLSPIVSAIDDWNRNWKLGLVFEARVGKGRLLVTSFDLNAAGPVAKQLRRSLLDYAAGSRFQPKVELALSQLRGLWFDTLVMRKLGATVQADGENAAAVIDGDPNSYWSIGAPARNRNSAVRRPHQLVLNFPQPVAMDGITLMPRQNDRDHSGDVCGYAVDVSDDDMNWREVAVGKLVSTWNPQTIAFPQTVTAKHLKFSSLSGFGTDSSSALAELAVLYAGPKLQENNLEKIEYRRSRSTSSDIDEGSTTTPAPAKP